jgi:hypothetical protein
LAKNCVSLYTTQPSHVEPARNTTTVTAVPTGPSHGVVRRSGTSDSTIVIGMYVLQIVCIATTTIVSHASMPSVDRYVSLLAACPTK